MLYYIIDNLLFSALFNYLIPNILCGIMRLGDNMNQCIEAVRNTSLFNQNKSIVVAVSGGIDSMVLLDVLRQLKKDLVIAHVNHMKREQSKEEYTYIAQYAKNHNIPFEGYELNDDITDNFQATARKKRRIFFTSVADKYNTNIIALGHHLDDQVETILMRFVSGYSLHTLKGINKVDTSGDYHFVHPFINLKKETLSYYAKENNLTYFNDTSNKDITFTRNRYRHVIIPLLVKENPNLHQIIKTYHHDLSAYESLLKDQSSQFLSTQDEAIDYNAFAQLNPLVQKYILKMRITDKINDNHAVSSAMIERLLEMLSESKGNFTYPLSKTLEFHKSYDTFFIAKSMQKPTFCLTITKEGLYPTDKDIAYLVSHENLTHLYSKHTVLWYNDKVFPLYIRNRKNGDKIHKKFGTKKIKDLLIDKKIPPHLRDDFLLLANDKEVLWIPFLDEEKDYEQNRTNKLYVYEVL